MAERRPQEGLGGGGSGGAETVVLAVDPSLRGTGYAVVKGRGMGQPRCLEYGVVNVAPEVSHSGCLLKICEALEEAIGRWRPEVLVIESTIFVQSRQTAILLGMARGAALLAAARHGLEVREFAPRKIKQAVSGRGAATKRQVVFMARALFGLDEDPPPDAADALAAAQAYFQSAGAAVAPATKQPRGRSTARRG